MKRCRVIECRIGCNTCFPLYDGASALLAVQDYTTMPHRKGRLMLIRQQLIAVLRVSAYPVVSAPANRRGCGI